MVRTPTKQINARPETIARRARERDMLPHLYDELPVQTETAYSTDKLAEKYGLSRSQMQDVAREWETAGIISRRFEFRKGHQGRTYWWFINYPVDEAQQIFEEYQQRTSAGPRARLKANTSLKTRLWELISKQSFATTKELIEAVAKTGPSTNLHNLTHVLYSLQKEGLITFQMNTTKDKIPYNIRARKQATNGVPIERGIEMTFTPEDKVEGTYDPTNFRHLPTKTSGGPIERIMPTVVEPVVESRTDLELYPNTLRLIKRADWLRQAAEMAEAAGEDEIALDIISKLDRPLSSIEAEAVALYNALVGCRAE